MILFPLRRDFTLFHDDFQLSEGLFQPITTFFSLLGVFVLFLSGILYRKKWPLFSFGVLFFLAGHSLESSFVPLELIHEHRNYIPSIGVLLVLFGVVFIVPYLYQRTFLALLASSLVVFVSLETTYMRVLDWSNNRQLVMVDAAYHPESSRSQYNLGLSYANAMMVEEEKKEIWEEKARTQFLKAAKLDPFQANGILLTLAKMDAITNGKLDDALQQKLEKGLKNQVSSPMTVTNFVNLLQSIDNNVGNLPFDTLEKLLAAFMQNKGFSNKDKAQVLAAAINVALQEKKSGIAFNYAKKARELYPRHLQHRINYTMLLIAQKKFELAEQEILFLKTADRYKKYEAEILELLKMIELKKAEP